MSEKNKSDPGKSLEYIQYLESIAKEDFSARNLIFLMSQLSSHDLLEIIELGSKLEDTSISLKDSLDSILCIARDEEKLDKDNIEIDVFEEEDT